MTRPRSRIGSELLPIVLILVCLAGTWLVIISMHRRVSVSRRRAVAPASSPPVVVGAPIPAPLPSPVPAPKAPPRLVEDPTRTIIARIGAAEAEQLLEAQAADRRAEALDRARASAAATSESWRRREQIVRAQADALSERARALEQEADALAMERDVLAHERDATKAALAKARVRSSFAVLPHRGANGTWRRPIMIECRNGTATFQPHGPTFSLLDLSSLLGRGTRSSPIVLAALRELLRTQGKAAPDGTQAIPYFFFVVRPDGIRPYYAARAQLEPLGIAFGYELVEADREIDFPDLDNAEEWDGTAPLPTSPTLAETSSPTSSRRKPGALAANPDRFRWPSHPVGGAWDSGGLEGEEGGLGGPRRTGAEPPAFGQVRGDRFGRGGSPANGGDPLTRGRPGSLGEGDDERLVRGRSGTGELDPGSGGGFGPGSTGERLARGGPADGGFDPLPPGGLDPGGRDGPPSGALKRTSDPSGPGGVPGMPPPMPAAAGTPGMLPPSGVAGSSRSGSLAPTISQVERLAGLAPESSQGGSRDTENVRRFGGALDSLPTEGGAEDQTGSPASGNPAGRPGRHRVPLGGPSDPFGGQDGDGNPAGNGSPGSMGSAGSAGGTSPSGGRGRGAGQGAGDRPPLKIEVPFEIVVACGPDGLVIHPGGYRLSPRTLKGKDPVFAKTLQGVLRQRQQVDPLIRPRPRVRFLVESGGNDVYWEARRQTVLSGVDWPIALQVADTRVLDFFPRETF